jgi:putative sigma-54 modulation protein
MDLNIQGQNLKVNPAIEAYAKKKLDKLDRYLPGISDVRLDLTVENAKRGGSFIIAQITIRHRRGAILRAEERSTADLETAINLAVDKMYRRIERFKGRKVDDKRRTVGGRFGALPEELDIAEELPQVEPATNSPYADYATIEEAQDGAEIVRRKTVDVDAMTEEEAELLGHDFFMFFNADTGSVNVLYKRKTGGYGVLEPKIG